MTRLKRIPKTGIPATPEGAILNTGYHNRGKWVIGEIPSDDDTHYCFILPPRDEGDTFTAHGLTWRKHTPGDPMPCEGEAVVRVLLSYEMCGEYLPLNDQANRWKWGTIPQNSEIEIIGWNYAD